MSVQDAIALLHKVLCLLKPSFIFSYLYLHNSHNILSVSCNWDSICIFEVWIYVKERRLWPLKPDAGHIKQESWSYKHEQRKQPFPQYPHLFYTMQSSVSNTFYHIFFCISSPSLFHIWNLSCYNRVFSPNLFELRGSYLIFNMLKSF